jgi:hypothetical protein
MKYHLQEIVNRLDHFAPQHEDLEVTLTVKIGGKIYWQTGELRRKRLIANREELFNE